VLSRRRMTSYAMRRHSQHEWSLHRDYFADISNSLQLPGELFPGADLSSGHLSYLVQLAISLTSLPVSTSTILYGTLIRPWRVFSP